MKSPFPPLFANQLRAWFRVHARDLPWRRTRDPYAILVSEFMLQQTQVNAVMPFYQRWLGIFPTLEALAASSEEEVLVQWQGLGYYSRARNLRLVAQEIVAHSGGQFPRSLASLRALPGLGDYTAGAVLTFAFDARVPIVDANIARVLARLANLPLPIDSTSGRKQLWALATVALPDDQPGEFNAALMELGALICLPKPLCPICPVSEFCAAMKLGNQSARPVKRARAPVTRKVERALYIEEDGAILLQRRAANPWKNMWTLPAMGHAPEPVEQPLLVHRYSITRYQVDLEIFSEKTLRPLLSDECWFTAEDIENLPIPSPHRRVLETLFAAKDKLF